MAIAKVRKIELIGLQKDKEELLRLLQKLGIVELLSVPAKEKEITLETGYAQANLLEIEEAISFLASLREKGGVLESIVKFKPLVYEQQLQAVITEFNYQNVLTELAYLRNELKELSQHKEKLIQERQLLLPWQKLGIYLDELYDKEPCGIILGTLNIRDYQSFLEDLEKAKINLFIDIVQRAGANLYLAILYIKEEFEQLDTLLKNYHFNSITLIRHKSTAKERIVQIDKEIFSLDKQIQGVKDKIQLLSKEQFKLMMMYDYLYNIKRTQEVEKNLVKQQFTFTFKGWIRQRDERLLAEAISRNFKDIAIFISEPQPDEDIPVILENRRLIQPFEFITNIYGMPKYNEIDPTPFLAPFFFLYFGFCVSDVGYGLTLILISTLALKKFRLGAQGLRFWKLFLFCGISTVIIGATTGSWFGNLFDLLAESNKIFLPLKRFKDSFIFLDPLQQPEKLLGIALVFGIIQVWFGNIVAAIGNLKNKRYLNVLFDQVTTLTLLFGLTGLGLIFLELLNKTHLSIFKYATVLGGIALIFTQGRTEIGLGSKLFYGMYNLYSALSGYLSDILSYSRLWALGLVTGVMANTINLISVQFSQILSSLIPFINRITLMRALVSSLILVIIFVAGHAVSLLMNLLGAFVHPLRLQFVEFFSKFFKSSGSSLKPFRIETKYIDINSQTPCQRRDYDLRCLYSVSRLR